MSITIKVGDDNVLYDGFESVRLSKSIEFLSAEFEFTATIQNPEEFPVKLNDTCQIFVNDVQVMQGYIERLSCETSPNSHTISIFGRDKVADIIDSSADPTISINGAISLVDLIKKALSLGNINDVDVINNVEGLANFTNDDEIEVETGETIFDFIERYCKKRQVLCVSDNKGNINLTRASTEVISRLLLSQSQDENNKNNIKVISFILDNSNRFNEYTVKSQGNTVTLRRKKKNALVDVAGKSTDSEIRESRKVIITSDSSLDINVARERAQWEANIRRARSLNINLTVAGFNYNETDLQTIWTINKLIKFRDDFWNINAELLIKSVEYIFNTDDGSITNLTLTNKDAYTTEAEEKEIDKKNEPKGKDLTL